MYTGMKWTLLTVIAVSAVALTPDTSWAQRGRGGWGRGGGRGGFSIGIGHGGVYAGYGRGGRGNWGGGRGWGNGFNNWGGGRGYYGGNGFYGGGYSYPSYGYSNGYYAPSYSQGTVIYSTPTYSSPVVTSTVTPNAPILRSGSGGDIVIENLNENGTAINYSLNGNNYTIQPGQTQRITNDRQWVVEFDRGTGQGTGRYTLSEGRFKFKSTDQGWELVRAVDQSATTQSTAKPPLPDPNLQPELNSLRAAPEPQQ